MEENNYMTHFVRELQILREAHNDESELIIDKFEEPIRSILEINGKQGHSGSSANFYAAHMSEIVNNAMLMKPLGPITGIDCEWVDVNDEFFQNNRECAVFKNKETKKSHYLDAIVWSGKEEWDTFTGQVEDIHSSQNISFPFVPKTFYIDVVKIYQDEAGEEYTYKIKDRKQLEKVAEYYDMEEEPKTLKDIDPEACCHGIRAPDLKKAAIAWVISMGGVAMIDDSTTIRWIMEFFNLNEEDIKNG